MKIVKAYRQTDTDRDVNIHEKQFHTEHLNPGDTVYRKVNGIYKANKNDVGTVQNILHDGYCAVIWQSTPTDDPEICKVSDLITTKKYNDIYTPTNIDASIDYDSTLSTTYNGTDYFMHYKNVNVDDSDELFHNWKEQITETHPYDDAEYYWAVIDQGTISYIYRGKVRKTEYYLTPEDEDIENEDYMDEISLRAIQTLNRLNKDIEPVMVHMSSDVESAEAIGVQDFDNNIYAAEDEQIEVETNDYIYLDLDNVEIDVYTDGSWDYVDTNYEFAKNPESRDGDYYVSEDEISDYELENAQSGFVRDALLRDYISVVEDFDELLESIIPRFTGRYALNGTAELIYDVDGVIYVDTYGYDKSYAIREDFITYTFDLDDVDFNKTASKSKFKVSISEVV